MRPTVVLIGSMYAPEAEELLEQHAVVRRVDDQDRSAVLAAVAEAHGVVARYPARIDAELIAAAPNLVAVLSSGRGVDNIDLDAATAAGVVVANNPGLGGKPVSEHALGLLLMVTRGLTAISRNGIEKAWDARLTTHRVELTGKVLGIIGLGNVGGWMARRAHGGFLMRVLAYDPYVSAEKMAEVGAEKVETLEELLSRADFVTCHPELNDETEYMFDDKAFAQMKPGAYFMNTSRGRVVDTAALARALRSGHLGGAALDVYEDEPLAADSPLLDIENLVLSAHIADFTVETKRALALSAATQLLSALEGKQPPAVLNPDAWGRAAERRRALLA
ncbi:NAD(P)-binding domain-containing protein [Streptacidiphilus sp. ASG 303]|uniref:NAD(P)-dependent oxidoreductase n=1 Tax=Streptacidiphilus sp. ASG 303 TaxID=2896847 RepID=UPI001E3F36BE|nr:NAD(P)-dependent oxidoreductase [Streptacidiphilus sp. ASG 303]MCD0485889.1 NAD(P)-binding domain-containing protein [Streptacidiphilus sp. ASG 303]